MSGLGPEAIRKGVFESCVLEVIGLFQTDLMVMELL